MGTDTVAARHQEWVRRNPLWVWRDERGYSRNLVASTLGVSDKAVQNWETGLMRPNGSNMARLVRLTRDDDFPAKWDRWEADRAKI